MNQALSDVHLKHEYVDKQPLGLLAPVAEYGDNLSVGQCQLICIARALLRRPKIILMDEATSSIDAITDKVIQTTVAEKFAAATVITIAHRLNTIMDANRIMVLKDGKIVEFDTPKQLLTNPNGLFASMHASMIESGGGAAGAAAAGAGGGGQPPAPASLVTPPLATATITRRERS